MMRSAHTLAHFRNNSKIHASFFTGVRQKISGLCIYASSVFEQELQEAGTSQRHGAKHRSRRFTTLAASLNVQAMPTRAAIALLPFTGLNPNSDISGPATRSTRAISHVESSTRQLSVVPNRKKLPWLSLRHRMGPCRGFLLLRFRMLHSSTYCRQSSKLDGTPKLFKIRIRTSGPSEINS